MIVAIHQPNLFPWLGYFDKIRRCDVFVFLDDVQFSKQSWINRVRVNVQGKSQWLTCPVVRETMAGPIRHCLISEHGAWRDKAIKTLTMNYSRAPNVSQCLERIEPMLRRSGLLADFNIAAICTIARMLGLKPRFVRQSALGAEGNATDLLIDIVRRVGGSTYLSGGGAQGYQDDEKFDRAGLRLVYQNFTHRPYAPTPHDLPGLSVIDYLMWAQTDAIHWDA